MEDEEESVKEDKPENNGMLFIFENEQTLSFWMKKPPK
jgi:uncharacterized membrane protein (UPF0127 family)